MDGMAWMTWSHFRGWKPGLRGEGGVENSKQFLSCKLTSGAPKL